MPRCVEFSIDTSEFREVRLVTDAAYSNYLRVRDEVRRLKGTTSACEDKAAPSAYWAEELSNIDYMAEASPLIVRKLRQHAFHVTGIRPYDYREYGDSRAYFERRLNALSALAGGTDLLVSEAEALGGFGYRIDGRLYNVDTIKFFEALIAMRRAGLLDRRAGGERRLVWEIGAGWGGFAYQFKKLFPATTYVIVDFAELFLFSATYLATMFPEATLRFWNDERGSVFDRWEEADFIFIPHDRVEALRGAQPDLLVNIISFQEMTVSQVEAYVRLAASIRCRSIYSFNRDRSPYNEEIDSVSSVLSWHYDLREIRLLGSGYVKATKKDSAVTLDEAVRTGRIDEGPIRHLVGTVRASLGAAPRTTAVVGIGATHGTSSVQRGPLSVSGWPRRIYARAKRALLFLIHGALVASRRFAVTGFVERTRERFLPMRLSLSRSRGDAETRRKSAKISSAPPRLRGPWS